MKYMLMFLYLLRPRPLPKSSVSAMVPVLAKVLLQGVQVHVFTTDGVTQARHLPAWHRTRKRIIGGLA